LKENEKLGAAAQVEEVSKFSDGTVLCFVPGLGLSFWKMRTGF
jgi:hypothetical protein